jgi:hypothetical protein
MHASSVSLKQSAASAQNQTPHQQQRPGAEEGGLLWGAHTQQAHDPVGVINQTLQLAEGCATDE